MSVKAPDIKLILLTHVLFLFFFMPLSDQDDVYESSALKTIEAFNKEFSELITWQDMPSVKFSPYPHFAKYNRKKHQVAVMEYIGLRRKSKKLLKDYCELEAMCSGSKEFYHLLLNNMMLPHKLCHLVQDSLHLKDEISSWQYEKEGNMLGIFLPDKSYICIHAGPVSAPQ